MKMLISMLAACAMLVTVMGCEDKYNNSGYVSVPETTTTESTTTEKITTTTLTTTSATTTTVTTTAPSHAPGGLNSVSLRTGGDTFTVAGWDANDVPVLLEAWEDNYGFRKNNVDFINFDCGGSDASDHYDTLFNSGDDLDVYFCEADWALKYINDDRRTAPLEQLGFRDSDFADMYAYTIDIGRATSGANAGKIVGASWQACPGGFAYRSDLADKYLGAKTPEEMQSLISDWDKFSAAAATVAAASDGKVAFADSLGGMWQAFSSSRIQPWVVDGKVTLDDSCRAFADCAKTLWNNGGVSHNQQWSAEWIDGGKNDACMGYFVPTWGFTNFFDSVSADSYGKWNVVVGPAPYFWGGTWIVVNPKTDNAEEAQSFIYNSAVDPDAMHDYALTKPDYVNNMKVMDEIVKRNECPDEYVTGNLGGQNYFSVLHETAKSINLMGLITPYDASIKLSFLNAVSTDYCKDGKSWESTAGSFFEDVYSQNPDLD